MNPEKKSTGRININSCGEFFNSVQSWFISRYGEFMSGKYFMGFVTVVFTILVMPLFRFIAQRNSSNRSKAADAGVWVLMNIFGIGIIIYPWWLATAKSPLYYSRLQYCAKIVSAIILILAGIQGIFTPELPFEKNDPSQTSTAFKVLSSLNMIAIFGGLLVVLPIFIRRDRLFKSNSLSLFRFAWLFTAIMLTGLLLRRWTGFTRIVSFSCLFLVIQFSVLYFVEEIEKQASGKLGMFDEAYIIVAGFVPFWLAFAVGATLLEINSQAGAVGTVFVYIAWRVVIYALEYMASEVGRKASRFSDGSVFSFSAIYTGATFANFIFLSVQFNSPTFWALLLVTVTNIIVVQGGIMIDIDYIFMDYVAVSHSWPFLHRLKVLYFEFARNMPHDLAVKVANCREQPTPEIQLALIRGRATVLQLNWTHNDIKMSSEFQALACAGTAVAMEIALSYLGVGANSITANLSDRSGVLYIYCVNILFSFFAQAIARKRLRNKVAKLKLEISATVKALESSGAGHLTRRTSAGSHTGGDDSYAGNRNSVRSTTSGSGRARSNSGVSGTGVGGARGNRRARRQSKEKRGSNSSVLSNLASRFQFRSSSPGPHRDSSPRQSSDEEREDDCSDDDDDDQFESHQLLDDQEVDTDALHAILGLCKLYATDDMIAMEENERAGGRAAAAASRRISAENSPTHHSTASAAAGGDGGVGRQARPFSPRDDAECGSLNSRKSPVRFARKRPNKSIFGVFLGGGSTAGAADSAQEEEDEDDGWEEVQLTTRLSSHFRASLSKGTAGLNGMFGNNNGGSNRRGTALLTNVVRMQGYLQKRKPGTKSEYQRRFFLLTDLQLMYFENEEDVEMHINRRKGTINIADITNVDRYDPSSLCIINVAVPGRVYVMLAADRPSADEWYDMIQEVRENYKAARAARSNAGKSSSDIESGGSGENQNSIADNSSSTSVFQQLFGSSDPHQASTASARPSVGFSLIGGGGGPSRESPNIGGGVTEMIRRGTTTARRGLGSIYYGSASSAFTAASTDASEEVWKHTWDVSHLPRKMGYLNKKGELNSAMKQRWFVLTTQGDFCWYEKAGTERTQKPKGSISLGEVVCVQEEDRANPLLVQVRHVSGRVYELEAGSELDATDWRRVLNLWIDSAREAIDAYNRKHKDPFIVGATSNTHDQDLQDTDNGAAAVGGRGGEEEVKDNEMSVQADLAAPRKMSGFLEKRGGLNSAFKRRWIVLDHPGVLTWYEKQKHEGRVDKEKGSLLMSEVMCVKEPREDAPTLLEIKHIQGRTYEINVPSVLEAEEWRAQLNKWLLFAHKIVKQEKAARRHSAAAPDDSHLKTTVSSSVPAAPTAATAQVSFEPLTPPVGTVRFGPASEAVTTTSAAAVGGGSGGDGFTPAISSISSPAEPPSSSNTAAMTQRYGMFANPLSPLSKGRARQSKEKYTTLSTSDEAAANTDIVTPQLQPQVPPLASFSSAVSWGAAAADAAGPDHHVSAENRPETPPEPDQDFGDIYAPSSSSGRGSIGNVAFVSSPYQSKRKVAAFVDPAPPSLSTGVESNTKVNFDLLPSPSVTDDEQTDKEDLLVDPSLPRPKAVQTLKLSEQECIERALENRRRGFVSTSSSPTPLSELRKQAANKRPPALTSGSSFKSMWRTTSDSNNTLNLETLSMKSTVSSNSPKPAAMLQQGSSPRKVNFDSPFASAKEDETLPRPKAVKTTNGEAKERANIERALENRRRGFTSSSPSPISELRKQGSGKRPPALSEQSLLSWSPLRRRPSPQKPLIEELKSHMPDPSAPTPPLAPLVSESTDRQPNPSRELPRTPQLAAGSTAEPNSAMRSAIRRQSTMTVAQTIENRRNGFTTETPQSIRQLRQQQGKRKNILGTSLAPKPGQLDANAIRRESDLADTKFLHRMAKRHSSELVDNMQKKSYKDMNGEFWVTHRWYLASVICFVTLNVLYTTAYIVSTYN